MADLPTGTVTFLFTDIEGSTRKWERHPEAMAGALARHDEILSNIIEAHRGYVFKTVGDAFCAAFPTAPEALEAALATQRALLEEEWGEPVDTLRVRMALHTGLAEERGGDYFGPPVNRVARLLSAGHGGQILLSGATRELVREELPEGADLRDLGERRLKDLFRPERVLQVVVPELPSSFPPLKTLDARPNNLPAQPTPLVGRESELGAVRERLGDPATRLLTLTGPGGTGKTRLALQAAAELLDEFADGTYLVALASITDDALVASAVAHPLGVVESADRSLTEGMKGFLGHKELLLLLDNFEQVLGGAPLVGELLAACPRLKVLATSRIPLRVYGEREYPVPPLALPDPRDPSGMNDLTRYEAVRLFIDRAKDARPDFRVSEENAPAVAEICARLDGLPLAIELAAARTRVLTPQAMLARLGNRLKLLKAGARDLPARQQTLRGAIDWSYSLLTEEDKVLFRRLSVFSGGRTLEAMEAVCDPEEDLISDVLDGVESLVDKSLLRREEGPDGEPRFVMLETIHEYAREKLEESAEAASIRRAHAEYFLTLAEEAEPELTGPDQVGWLERLEAEHDNLRAALAWSLGGGDAELGLRLGGALGPFWARQGYWSEGLRFLEEGLAVGAAAPAGARAKALQGAGVLAGERGDYGVATKFLEESLELYRQVKDQSGAVFSLCSLAEREMNQGNVGRASALLEESLTLSRESGTKWDTGFVLAHLGLLKLVQDEDYEQAEALWKESSALMREVGDIRFLETVTRNRGINAMCTGDYAEARVHLEESLTRSRESGSKQGVALSLVCLGTVALLQGEHERAAKHFTGSIKTLHELGDLPSVAGCMDSLAATAGAQGETSRAARLFAAGAALREAIGAQWPPDERVLIEPYLKAVRSRLDEASWKAAWEEGRAMRLEEAISYALKEDG